MSAKHEEVAKGAVVNSPLGQKRIDSEGAPISGVRMEVSRAYAGIPGLLQKVINDNDAAAWKEITDKIDTSMTTSIIPWWAWIGRPALPARCNRRSGQVKNCYSSPTWYVRRS